MEQVLAFYQAKAPEMGWTAEREPLLHVHQAMLSLRKDSRKATVIIEQVDPGQARVMVRLSRAPSGAE
jgi:hypothetical protein